MKVNKQTKKTLKLLSKTNKPDFNLVKLSEELFELGEVLMKMNNKGIKHQPPLEKLIEELGDVELRIEVLKQALDIKKEVTNRVESKSSQLQEFYNTDLYIGGL